MESSKADSELFTLYTKLCNKRKRNVSVKKNNAANYFCHNLKKY